MRSKLKSIVAGCLISLVAAGDLAAVAGEIGDTSAEAMTQQALELFKQGMLNDALAAQRKAIAVNPSSSLAHASMSYLAWKQGDVLGALNEGETAVKLSHDQAVYLINLALMMQDSEGYTEAISLYTGARKLVPESWVPIIGIARCDILSGNQARGNAALQSMADQNGRSFEWYYMTAKTAIENEQLNTAEIAVSKALDVAKAEPEKGAASSVALLAALRADDAARARELFRASLKRHPPKSAEIYVRTANALLSANEPNEGNKLLDSAIANLKSAENSEAFLKLGQLFEEKSQKSVNSTDSRAWLDNAQTAYATAILLRPVVPAYHLALAGALYRKGLNAQAAEEFKKITALDQTEMLSPFLASKLLAANSETGQQPVKLTLSRVRFKIIGLSCGCKLARLRLTLRESGAIVFVNTPPEKPYVGQILVDQSIPVEELLHRCEAIAIPHLPTDTTPPDDLKLEVISKEPVTSIDDAIKIAEGVAFGPIMVFGNTYADVVNRYKEVRPVVPVSDSGTATDINNGAAWRIQL